MPWKEKDPLGSGFKEEETSEEAADKAETSAAFWREAALAYITANPGRTADEVAAALKKTPYTIRPRVSELRKAGLIVNDGRGVNASGAKHRWRVAEEVA
ncbi:winged helix-turn-helix domain-containing protein [Bradyrhizobium septentrionale]|uniref:MarR family transcriptional regulator n=1 Tax=Bradyrhizobium septentrionale TaxID=1404411 RepID=UPI0015967682|nr:helix-turn-helix domain-containing protein [Bradyrhizobium septentrionale]UGY23836.1 winged helix-turn-helix domain-containing protein [Bradyrhizobium septentrionale]